MPNVLLIGDTIRSTDLRHAVPVEIGDPFRYAELEGRRVAVVWSVEGDRITAVDPGIEIVPAETFPADDLIRDGADIYEIPLVQTVRIAKALGLREAIVPRGFPLGHADALRADGVELHVDQRAFDDRRRRKTAQELDGIRAASRAAEAGMSAIVDLLTRSEPGDGGRAVDGEPLTCELLQAAAIEKFGEHGCRGDDLIVARGPQAADGHDRGSGRLANDDVLVCDLFPRHGESAYFSDMTRTFAVGSPDSEIATWHEQTLEALELARGLARAGVNGGAVHRAVCAFYEERGHPTQMSVPEGTVLRDGFYHGLGHGVGLDVHESPSLGKIGHELVVGDVITLEPGLYRHGFGGVRLEDTLLVTEDGVETITEFPYDLDPTRTLAAAR
ncbi:MAG: aminopeptidase P family protein [Actinobacteria bacterium]|nr:aminopeptidase P family protein [Actinomycetota bacterium]